MRFRIGIISDTHGVVHPRVADVFASVDAIVHAGDVGGAHVLDALRELAPVTFVEGNIDDGAGEGIVRATFGGLRVLLTHVLPRPHAAAARVMRSLRSEAADVVVFGHSHLPHDEVVNGVRYFNPASAGPRRFDYPVSVGVIEQRNGKWETKHVALDERSIDALQKRMNQLSR
ncbi:MAG TPA: metallophosphoesterase family protein [Thermoanaerobaculia bacterium]|nr:metallophosphoesterase family protein [Thermoanaerobaculia bacterium]